MHALEPYYAWRNHYVASDDPNSPFHNRVYNEFAYHLKVYDHYIHPQWDNMGSSTLFLKIIFADYDDGYAFIELLGEWNDILYNDIMFLKRDIVDTLIENGIDVKDRVPILIVPSEHNLSYLRTKASRMGHLLEV